MKIIKIREVKTDKVIHEVDVSTKSERQIDKIVDGMMINLNHQDFWIDDSCVNEPERELIK